MYLTKWPWIVYIKVYMESACDFFSVDNVAHLSERGKKQQLLKLKK